MRNLMVGVNKDNNGRAFLTVLYVIHPISPLLTILGALFLRIGMRVELWKSHLRFIIRMGILGDVGLIIGNILFWGSFDDDNWWASDVVGLILVFLVRFLLVIQAIRGGQSAWQGRPMGKYQPVTER